MEENNIYLHIGSDFKAPKEWINYEASPFIYLERIPFLGFLFIRKQFERFPLHIKYGDIVTGLKDVKHDSCSGIYCSHVLEHLSLVDFRKAINNIHSYLKPNGIFRLVVPDLEWAARSYIQRLENGDFSASLDFCGEYTFFGSIEREKGIKGILKSTFGTSKHYWMWDKYSMKHELIEAGFTNIKECKFNDSKDKMFELVEEEHRFIETKSGFIAPAVALECSK